MATKADYEEVLADHRRNVRALDVAMHGKDGAAKQASLCDLIPLAKRMREELDDLHWIVEHLVDHVMPDEDCEECAEMEKAMRRWQV
jgi:hypothetical protein